MASFDSREKAFESKAAHDADTEFKVQARACKLVGLWAAGHMGKTGDEAAEYASSVVIADLKEAGFEDVIAKLIVDLGTARADLSDHQIRREWDDQMAIARKQIQNGE